MEAAGIGTRPQAGRGHRQAVGAHGLGFKHIVGRVAEKDHPSPCRARSLGDEPVAGGTGRGGDSGARLWPVPGQDPVGKAQPRGPVGAPVGPGAAFRLQAMVNGQREKAAPARPRPGVGGEQQGQGIAAAGKGYGQRGVDVSLQPGIHLAGGEIRRREAHSQAA